MTADPEMVEPASPLPVRFGPDGLVPATIQDVDTGAVLMVAFMNAEALARTLATGRTHFWSRSRGKLWRKGETSGHEQIVEDIHLNCEQNSLLVSVRQIGACCHDGYPTCYYRRLEADGSLTVVQDRWFDPADVYGAPGAPPAESVETLTRRWYGAYEFLRDHDLEAESSTSRRLRRGDPSSRTRVFDELNELAGVLDGVHVHGGPAEDTILEGSQCLYWLAVTAVQDAVPWEALRPDRALLTGSDVLPPATAARVLRAEAARWSPPASAENHLAARCHAAIAIVAQACAAMSVAPPNLIRHDLGELRSRPYLSAYFSGK